MNQEIFQIVDGGRRIILFCRGRGFSLLGILVYLYRHGKRAENLRGRDFYREDKTMSFMVDSTSIGLCHPNGGILLLSMFGIASQSLRFQPGCNRLGYFFMLGHAPCILHKPYHNHSNVAGILPRAHLPTSSYLALPELMFRIMMA